MERIEEKAGVASRRVGLGQLTTGARAQIVVLPILTAIAVIGGFVVGGRMLEAANDDAAEEARNRAGAIAGLETRLAALEGRADRTDLAVGERIDGLDQRLAPIGPAIMALEGRLQAETQADNADVAMRARLDSIEQALAHVGLTLVRKVWTGLNLPPDYTAELWAECPAGQVAVSGGHDSGNRWLMIIEDKPDPSAAERWIVRVWNHDDTAHGAGDFEAYAVCAPSALVTQSEAAAGAVTPGMRDPP